MRTPVASVRFIPEPAVMTMLGAWLPITDWADGHGELGCAPDQARFALTGPDHHGECWTVDVQRLERVPPPRWRR